MSIRLKRSRSTDQNEITRRFQPGALTRVVPMAVGAFLLISSANNAAAQDDYMWRKCAEKGMVPKSLVDNIANPLDMGGGDFFGRNCKACPPGHLPDVANKTCKPNLHKGPGPGSPVQEPKSVRMN
jgi:hypothetical protein